MKRIFLGLLCAILMVSFATGCGKEETPQNEEQNNVVDNNEFSMPIEEIFTITGRGVVAKGTIQKGDIRIGDKVRIICEDEVIDTEVVGIEINRKQLEEANTGDNVGIILKDVTRTQVMRGQVLAKPNSIVNSKKFDADIHVYLQDEGGRNESISSNEKLVYYLRTLDIAGELQILNDAGKLNPGEDGKITVILNSKMALEVGTEFSIRENGRIVAKGTITKVY